jgi:DNA-binding transcriptional LysR family regulator
MNWQAISFDWNQVRAFLATVEEGSLSAAARALGLTQPTLGRQVAALEQELGVTLFDRSGRKLLLTPSGLELADHVRAMGEAATALSLAATGQAQSVEGLVRITASEIYSAFLLPPIIAELRRSYPGIRLDIVATNSLSDLRRREADIAIRNNRPTDPDLIARKIRMDHGALYASAAYLATLGPVASPADFSDALFLGFGDNAQYIDVLTGLGFRISERNFDLSTENHLVLWAMARAGLGIGVVPVLVGDADPDMQRILPDLPPVEYPIWLVAPRELKTSRRVRVVYDLLAKMLA